MSPELSISQRFDASLSLNVDDFLDALVFNCAELLRRTFLLVERNTLIQEDFWSLERANVFCSERGEEVE